MMSGLANAHGHVLTAKIDAHGGYTEADKTLLLCVVRPSEVSKVLSIIKEYDETAFVTVSEVGEILGDGFRKLDM